jgi:hypothetical protein
MSGQLRLSQETSDPANVTVAFLSVLRSDHRKSEGGRSARFSRYSLLSGSTDKPSLATRARDEAGKSEAVVEGDDHGGELVVWLCRTMPSLNTCSTTRQSSIITASAFFPALPLPAVTMVEVRLAAVPTPSTLHGGR